MNVPYYVESYLSIPEWVRPITINGLDDEAREQAGYSLEEVLLWRDELKLHMITPEELVQLRQVDEFLLSKAAAILDKLGVDVKAFLTCPF